VHLLNTLISYWKLDEASGTRNDSQGTNHLSPINSPTAVAAKINNGLYCNTGSLQALSCASNASLQVTSDFTFSIWVRIDDLPAHGSFIITKDDFVGNRDYDFYHDNVNGFTFQAGTVGGTSAATVGAPVSGTGQWHHIVVWYDSSDSKARLRVDDTTTYAASATSTLVQTGAAFKLGYDNSGLQLGGCIDEVGFWKRKLTAAEMTALYNGGAALPFSSFTT
jgi:hypothetical protein